MNVIYSWCGGHSINTSSYEGLRVGVQVFKKKLHIHIYLDYIRVELLS